MRILHVLDHSLPLHSGYAFRTAAILREQQLQGLETLQLTTPRQNDGSALEEHVDGLHFLRTPLARRSVDSLPGVRYVREMAATERRIAALVRQSKPDVIQAHSPVLNAIPAMRVARRLRVPFVYEVRTLWEDSAVERGATSSESIRYRASRGLETWILRRADHVTPICEGLRAEIVRRGVASDRVTVIPNAVDTASFAFGSRPDPELRARLGLTNRRVLGYAGSFSVYEGLDLLLEAVASLLPRRPDLAVLLLGGGAHEAVLRERAASLGLSERVVFTGRIPHAEVQRYYDLIDVLVYPRRPSRLTDLVTPLKPLEAMAQGRILVASDVGGHRELVRDGETGYLCRAGDASALAGTIEKVLADEASWPRMAQRARAYVESERTWSASVGRYRHVYSSVVGRG